MGKIVTLKHSGNGGGPRSAAAKHSNNGGGAKPAISTMVAEARKKLVASAGKAARTASNISNGNRIRFSSDPPYSSSRRLESGEQKLCSR